MIRGTLLAIALGGVAAAGLPHASARAQSGDALAHAERTCLDYGLRPHSDSYDVCVRRAADAFARGAPDLAYADARAVRSARDTCLSLGTIPNTLGYRQCLNVEIDRRAERSQALRYGPSDEPRPHAIVRMDGYGNRYDRAGNLLDRDGYVFGSPPRY